MQLWELKESGEAAAGGGGSAEAQDSAVPGDEAFFQWVGSGPAVPLGAGGQLFEDEDGDVANEFLVEGPAGLEPAPGAKAVSGAAAAERPGAPPRRPAAARRPQGGAGKWPTWLA